MWTIVPSSISEPRTLVPTISGITGRTTPRPSPAITGPAQYSGETPTQAANIASRITKAGSGTSSHTRRRPKRLRAVSQAIVDTSGLQEVREDALQRLVSGHQLAHPDAGGERDLGQDAGETAVIAGPDGEPGSIDLDTGDRRLGHQSDRQGSVVAGADGEDGRPGRHQPTEGAEVTGGGEPARDDDLHRAGNLLDLLQDVR